MKTSTVSIIMGGVLPLVLFALACDHAAIDEQGELRSALRTAGDFCDGPGDCASGHCSNDICCDGADSTCCLDSLDCPADAPVCSDDHVCQGCRSDNQCAVDFPESPRCNIETGACVQCTVDADCRTGSIVRLQSPLGLCTPDNTCTCWIDGDRDSRWSCERQADCPDGLVCAKERNMMMHNACLRPCDTETAPDDGFGCAWRTVAGSEEKQLLWGPMTSCHAFEMFGRSCKSDHFKCRAVANITPWFEDGYCLVDTTERCSYFCNDLEDPQTDMDAWCPKGYTCVNKVCEAADPAPVR